jgi:hypothetical protein
MHSPGIKNKYNRCKIVSNLYRCKWEQSIRLVQTALSSGKETTDRLWFVYAAASLRDLDNEPIIEGAAKDTSKNGTYSRREIPVEPLENCTRADRNKAQSRAQMTQLLRAGSAYMLPMPIGEKL